MLSLTRCSLAFVLGVSSLARAEDPAPLTPTQLAQAAQKILEGRCYNCHGQPGQKVKGGFDHVLDFEKLRTGGMLNLKRPLDSVLFQRIKDDEMPPAGLPLSAQDKATILKWIEVGAPGLNDKPKKQERTLPGGLHHYIIHAIADDLSRVPQEERATTRYLSLAHYYLAGDSQAQLKLYREALNKLANSLSWKPALIILEDADEESLILRLNLKDFGWAKELWERVGTNDPYALFFESEEALTVYRETETFFPFIRADRFLFDAARPPFYYDFLELPKNANDLERSLLQVNVDENIAQGKALRGGFLNSGISISNRMMERHQTRFGHYWKSYDFASNTGKGDLFENPLGPASGNRAHNFKHDGGEMIFSLPNGLQGYYLSTAAGTRLDEAPIAIVQDTTQRNPVVINGLSCMSCHTQGVKIHEDQILNHVQKQKDHFPADVIAEVKRLYRGNDELDKVFKEDTKRFLEALVKLGVRSEGPVEPVRSLMSRFETNMSFEQAAAEIGLTPEELDRKMAPIAELKAVADRLRSPQGLPREQFFLLYSRMIAAAEFTTGTKVVSARDREKLQGEFKVGASVIVLKALSLDRKTVARARGNIKSIEQSGAVRVTTESGFVDYEGSPAGLILSLTDFNGFAVGERVLVRTKAKGSEDIVRTSGVIVSIGSDRIFQVRTGPGFENYQGTLANIQKEQK